jgi:hypothetical protein
LNCAIGWTGKNHPFIAGKITYFIEKLKMATLEFQPFARPTFCRAMAPLGGATAEAFPLASNLMHGKPRR